MAGEPKTFRREKTAVRIAQHIVQSIRREGMSAGTRLPPERDMIESFGVGRGTLREALRYLELQGVLEIKPGPGGGPIVRAPNSGNLANTLALLLEFSDAPFRAIAESRLMLEPMVARLAAKRISTEQLADLRDSVVMMEQDLEDQAVFLSENRRFHDIVAWSSGNALFAHLVDSVVGISDGSTFGTEFYLIPQVPAVPARERKETCTAHREILVAIEDGDAEAAFDAMERHIQHFIDYIEKRHPHVLDKPVTWDQFLP